MKDIYADVITIGDEILYGQIVDTNSQWISAELDKIGVRTLRKTSVGDKKEEIVTVFREAELRSSIILVTGGLGPTSDDITKSTMAEYFNSRLILNKEALIDVTRFFKSKGIDLSELNRQQAFLPQGCEHIPNRSGTAPGMWFEKNGKVFISMPGVPFEMKAMMIQTIIPKLKERFKTPVIYHKIIRTVGIGESVISEKIHDIELALPENIKLAYLPSLGEVKLRLTARGENLEELRALVDLEVLKLRKIIGDYIYGFDEDLLEKVIGDILINRKMTISCAESCTGGYISYSLTTIPGSSEYFNGSVVAYQNKVKMELLEVNGKTLEKYGAVSEQTVREMAEGVRKKFGTDVGVSSSGIAGPGGGTEEKPVGTVWIALARKEGTITKKLTLGNDRDINVKRTTSAVFNLIWRSLVKNN